MAAPRRILRLQQLILEVVAETIQREVQDPRVGMVSVTRVHLSPDLSAAQVHWSMLGTDAEKRTTERGLHQALPLLQRRVAAALATRVTPTISLRFDPSMEKAQRLNEIFDRLRAERGEPPAEADAVPASPGEAQEPEDDLEGLADGEEIPPEDLPRDEDFEDDE
jgi:ribosome-binding factor A